MGLAQEYLKAVLDYCPTSGHFTWKRSSRGTGVGDRAGSPCGRSAKHIRIKIDKQSFYAHRLAWLWVYGENPPAFIDHIDRNGHNNAIANLRLATQSQNKANVGSRPNSRSRFKGVYRNGDRWVSQITVNKKGKSLGSYRTEEEAARAYDAYAVIAHGEFAMTNKALGLL